MRLRHALLCGALTTIAAIMLLSVFLPQNAAAGPRQIVCYSCSRSWTVYPSNNGDAKKFCKNTAEEVTCWKGATVVCRNSANTCLPQ